MRKQARALHHVAAGRSTTTASIVGGIEPDRLRSGQMEPGILIDFFGHQPRFRWSQDALEQIQLQSRSHSGGWAPTRKR